MSCNARGNQTHVTEFILLGFGELPEQHLILFLPFLLIYIVTMTGNLLILALVVADQHLHTPMYFFLGSLSFLEICYTSNILPRMLASAVTGNRSISFHGCFVQYYFFGCFAATECYLLAVMSYDRYLAICKPLHYTALMNTRVCLQLVTGSWISGFLSNSILTLLIASLSFCGPNEIDHFFCDSFPMIKLSCSNSHIERLMTSFMACVTSLIPFMLTLASYICIITTIMKIPSTTGRKKAFSTCSSHLIVVTLFYGSIIFVYGIPQKKTLKHITKVFSAFFTILTPILNPLIYSLRNKEVKEALKKAMHKVTGFKKGFLISQKIASG
ncbi:olfactory receptor 6C75-like [Alligator sinensis]|uniref:Olfactory receptor n=1 Tax=Alligator sinensis TaxID=38654 RepID=A0A3Q0FTJ5_ALLSI|nr:olfactory receptor 6C75-like [Alligator sinensis]